MMNAPHAGEPADAALPCRPGTYTGTFNGSIQLAQLPVNSVTGTIHAELARAASTQNLTLQNAHVTGIDQDGSSVTADVTGMLDCTSMQLLDGRLEHGNYHAMDGSSDTTFDGDAHATYSKDPPALVGTWDVGGELAIIIGGQGTWNVTLSAATPTP
jgi:hypothetical protein